MNAGVRARLIAMMFLEYFVWGGWATVLFLYLGKILHFSDPQIGLVNGLQYLACIVAPFIGGQIADRYMPTQKFLGGSHILAGIFLALCATQHSFGGMMLFMALSMFFFAPTLALTNSLAFHHLKGAPEGDFGYIRVGGTIGWIVAGVCLLFWRSVQPGAEAHGDLFLMSGIAGVILGLFCFTLPHTPPKGEGSNPLAFMEALKLLKQPSFAVFMLIAFVVTTELQFYYLPTSGFLVDLGKVQSIWPGFTVTDANVAAVMTIAQVAEILAVAVALPIYLPKIGIRKALALGVIVWPLRYLVFALGHPLWLIVLSLALHGIGYTFFFVVSQIYVDKVAPSDIRASAQALLTLVTLGIGNWLGTMFTSAILAHYTIQGATGTAPTHNWTPVFLVPCLLTVACAVLFLVAFKDKRAEAGAAPGDMGEAIMDSVEGGTVEDLAQPAS